jgi:uncharacterized protein
MTPSEQKERLKLLNKVKDREFDTLMHEAHEKAFSCVDCLQCGNCCKTTGPMFTDKDITRISKHLKMKEPAFVAKYLRRDEDDFIVLQEVPCPFLGSDNYCSIYDVRPKACKEYPHTDRVKQKQILGLTLENEKVCPAVEMMLKDITAQLKPLSKPPRR